MIEAEEWVYKPADKTGRGVGPRVGVRCGPTSQYQENREEWRGYPPLRPAGLETLLAWDVVRHHNGRTGPGMVINLGTELKRSASYGSNGEKFLKAEPNEVQMVRCLATFFPAVKFDGNQKLSLVRHPSLRRVGVFDVYHPK